MKTEKEILEAVRVLQEANPHDEGIQNWVRNYFPELKESEDKQSKKWILEYLYDGLRKSDEQFKGQFKVAIAWLEKQDAKEKFIEKELVCIKDYREKAIKRLEELGKKQGEQKTVIEMKTPEESLGIDSDTYNKIVDECVYGEQNPGAWSEEDELMLVSIIQTLKLTNGAAQMKIDWLKSIKERILPKSTWSEKDEVKMNRIVACLENLNVADNDILLKDVDWLKSLRPQSQWKPSDEQIEILDMVLTNASMDDNIARILRELREQLKKLKG